MNGCWQLTSSDLFPGYFLSQSILSCNTDDIYYIQSVTAKNEKDSKKSKQTESNNVSAERDKIIITRYQSDTRREVLEAEIKVLQYRHVTCKDSNNPGMIFSVFDCSANFDTLVCDTHGPLPEDRCIETFHLNYLQNAMVVNLEVSRDGQVFKATRYLTRYERTLPPELLKYIKSIHSKDRNEYIYPQSVSLTSRHVTSVDPFELNSQLLEKRYLKSSLLDHVTFSIVHTCEIREVYTPSIIRRRGAGRRVQIDGFDEPTSRKLSECVEAYARAYDCALSVRVFIGAVRYGNSVCWYVCHRYTHYNQFHQYLLETLKSDIQCVKMRSVEDSVDDPSDAAINAGSPNYPKRLHSSAAMPLGRQSEVDLSSAASARPSEIERVSFRRSISNTSAADEPSLVFDFPEKMYFGNSDATLCYQRRVKLERYVQYLLKNRKKLSRNITDLLLWFLDVPAQLQQFSILNDSGDAKGADAEFDSKVKRIPAAARDAIRLHTPESNQLTLCVPDTVTVATDNPKIDHFPPILKDQIRRTLQGNNKKKSKLSFYFVEVSFGSAKWVLVYRYTEFHALHKFVVKQLEKSIKELTAHVTELAAQADEERAYEDASARLDKLTDAHHNLPHFPWKRIDLMSQADKVTSKRRGQFETYLKYLVEVRAFYSETIANVLLQFLEVRLSYFFGCFCMASYVHNVFSTIFYSYVYTVPSPLQALEISIETSSNNNNNARSLFGSLYDDDYETDVPRLLIPFCRRGHTQITGSYFNATSGRTETGVIVFGGEGINYFNPHDSFLRDIWTLKVFENKDTLQYDFDWDLIIRRFRNDSIASWPERRSNFGSSVVPSSGNMVIYGGENRNRQIPDSAPFFEDVWVYLGAEHTWVRLPEAGADSDDERRALSESKTESKTSSSTSASSSSSESIDSSSDRDAKDASEGLYGDSGASNVRPGARKDSLLVVLPLSNRLLIIGGDTLSKSASASYRSRRATSSVTSGSTSRSASDQEVGVTNGVFNRHLNSFDRNVDWSTYTATSTTPETTSHHNRITSTTASAVQSKSDQLETSLEQDTSIFGGATGLSDLSTGVCMSDVFLFNASVDTLARRIYRADLFDTSPGAEGIKWTKMARFPGFCLGGASATAVVDPVDGKEKVLVFGGRFASRRATSRSRTLANNAEADASSSSSSSSNKNRHGGFTSQQSFTYSNKLWIFDPDANEWTYEGPSPAPLAPGAPAQSTSTVGVNWPYGRDRHAATYHAESGTLFISGGRVSCYTSPHLPTTASTSGTSGGTTGAPTDAASTACASASQYMDIWAYNLHSKRWTRLPPHPGSPNLKSATASQTVSTTDSNSNTASAATDHSLRASRRNLLLLTRDQPDARYLHSMSILPASSALDAPLFTTQGATTGDSTASESSTTLSTGASTTGVETVEIGASPPLSGLSDALIVVFGGQFGKPWSTSPLGFQPRSQQSAAALGANEGGDGAFAPPSVSNHDAGGGGGDSSDSSGDVPGGGGGGGGGYFNWDRHTVFDDDAQGYPGLHAQTNDLWVYTVSKEVLAQLMVPTPMQAAGEAPQGRKLQMRETKRLDLGQSVDVGLYGWKMVSPGGCTAGADGKPEKPTVDPTGLVIAIMVLLALVAGLLAFRLFKPAAGLGDAGEPDERTKLLQSGGTVSRLGSDSDDAAHPALTTSTSHTNNNYGSSSGGGGFYPPASVSGPALTSATLGYNSSAAPVYLSTGAPTLQQKSASKYQAALNESSQLDSGGGGGSSMAQYIRSRSDREATEGIF